jgi:hypothetical protein
VNTPDVKKILDEGTYNKLDSRPPPGAKRPLTVGTLEATVENKPQELRRLRSYAAACLHIPGNIPSESQVVLSLLFDCFEKQRAVKEGLIGDLIWGFAQTTPPVPYQASIDGLRGLQAYGLVKFQAKDGSYVGFDSDKITGAWVRYQPKLLNMVWEGTAP